MTLWGRNIADNGAASLGGGTLTLQVSYHKDPDPGAAADWQDYADADGNTIEMTIGQTYMISSRAPWLALELDGATDPDLVVYVSG
jgi:hypothetical protein